MEALQRWTLLLRIPIALIGVILFFAVYNRFVLNSNLENLKTSLSILDESTGVGQAEAALLLVDQALIAQMSEEELDLKKLASIQYIQGTLATDQLDRSAEDAQAMVISLAETESEERPALLKTLDGLTTGVGNTFKRVSLLPRRAFQGATTKTIDQSQLEEAARAERSGLNDKAVLIYERLLQNNPKYENRAKLKLRLGNVYLRLPAFDKAKKLFKEASKESTNPQEVEVAQRMIYAVDKSKNVQNKIKSLEKEMAKLGRGTFRQEAAHKLGSLYIQLYSFEKAAQVFRQGYQAAPKGKLALSCRFKEGWCLRSIGKLDEAFKLFEEIAKQDPGSSWSAASYHQIAEAHKAKGDYESATQAYEKILSETQDYAFAAITHAQAGSTYQFDLKQPDRAQIHFRELEKSFPASQMATIERSIQKIQTKKGVQAIRSIRSTKAIAPEGTMPAPVEKPTAPLGQQLAEGTPLMAWLENFIPVFVDVFTERLARYMEIAEVDELKRRFSEDEFTKLVVRRVRQRFPGQVTNVKTKITKEGFVGSGNVRLGILKFRVETRIGIVVKNERPSVEIYAIKIGKLETPEFLRKVLETRVNLAIEESKYPLRIKEYKLENGYAYISVQLVKPRATSESTRQRRVIR